MGRRDHFFRARWNEKNACFLAGPRVPRDTNMDFQRDQLPVACGEARNFI